MTTSTDPFYDGGQGESAPNRAFRPSARVLLLDRDRRVLLFRNVEEGHSLPDFWIAPGGRVETGESFEVAARREIHEETGLLLETLGPCVWRRLGEFRFAGTSYETDDRFFLVRIELQFEPSRATLEAVERAAIREHKWWSPEELERAGDVVFVPRTFVTLMREITEGMMPRAPITLTE